MAKPNQNPEQIARDNIDTMLAEAGWKVQDNKHIDFNAGLGVAVREFQTDIGPADCRLTAARFGRLSRSYLAPAAAAARCWRCAGKRWIGTARAYASSAASNRRRRAASASRRLRPRIAVVTSRFHRGCSPSYGRTGCASKNGGCLRRPMIPLYSPVGTVRPGRHIGLRKNLA
jgi:hypothetical protein